MNAVLQTEPKNDNQIHQRSTLPEGIRTLASYLFYET